jgi:hypothetical protein
MMAIKVLAWIAGIILLGFLPPVRRRIAECATHRRIPYCGRGHAVLIALDMVFEKRTQRRKTAPKWSWLIRNWSPSVVFLTAMPDAGRTGRGCLRCCWSVDRAGSKALAILGALHQYRPPPLALIARKSVDEFSELEAVITRSLVVTAAPWRNM